MTLEELKIKLQAFNVPTNLYSITTGGLPNERLCIINEGGMWQVYYGERGIKSGLKSFETENEACDYFWRKVSRYASGEDI
ncbi:MAG: hypothetical protein ACI4LK_00730 [Lentihominibacter sp.]